MSYSDRATQSNSEKVMERRQAGQRLPLKTGACLAGWHEGKKPRTREGVPIKTCSMFEDCPCKCHADLDELFKLSGKARELVINPEYVPPRHDHALFRPTVAAPGLLSGESVDVGESVSPAPGVVPGEKNQTVLRD